MARIQYAGPSQVISDAVQDANYILDNEDFHQTLSEKEHFELANATGKIISDLIIGSKVVANVQTYKAFPTPPWSRANAYTTPSEPNNIYLNRRRLNRSIESIAATLVHEYVHLVDYENDQYSFGHGDNRAINKRETAPYWIDILAYEMLSGKEGKVVFQHGEEHQPNDEQ